MQTSSSRQSCRGTMPSICIPPRAPGGIPRCSAVVPVSSRGPVRAPVAIFFLPPLPFCEARKEWTEPGGSRKKKKAEAAVSPIGHATCMCVFVCDVRHTVRACTRIVKLYTLRSVRCLMCSRTLGRCNTESCLCIFDSSRSRPCHQTIQTLFCPIHIHDRATPMRAAIWCDCWGPTTC